MRTQRNARENVLVVRRVADLIQRINQGALVVGLECKMEIDRGPGGRVT